ncbi:MAG: hypothetical protein K9K32_06730 [Halanaerobiales bacterium]|nr:hypothetical protein [Halanaerobiales bacterium]
MKINKTKISGMKGSVMASGYPMNTDVGIAGFNIQRANKLANNPPGTGHNCFLKGIIVQADITAPQYFWLEFQRYHFADIVSSQSKMHRITKMDVPEQCNKYVSKRIIDELERIIEMYNEHVRESDKYLKWQTKQEIKQERDELFQEVVSNCPMGLQLTARITTNYLQLKTIYLQRRPHRLEEWQIFCDWIEKLPHSEWITNNG